MPDAFTPNRNIVQPTVGGDSGTWGGILNSAAFAQIDTVLGTTQPITITTTDITLSTAQWNNCAINLTGALTGNHNLILPYAIGSSTVAVGGLFAVANNTTGAFTVTVLTVASGSVGVTIPQGVRTFLYSDGTNVYNADDSKLQIIPYNGNPNGHVAGTAASINNPPSLVWDYTNFVIYVCTTTGTTSTAVWLNSSAASATIVTPQGYLTPVSNTPIITGDSIAATTMYYTPFIGATAAVHNGSLITPYPFIQMPLVLTPSQSANNIYDIFLAYNSGVPVIGTGPSWLAGGGSITAGSCARGSGGGSTAINRATTSGLWVNTNSIALIYNTGSGNNTITVAAGQGVFLGSIYIDATAGQVTCHRSAGQNRKWGISNAYNREPTSLIVADPTASWTYATNTIRASNNTPSSFSTNSYNVGSGTICNGLTVLNCLPEEGINILFSQTLEPSSATGAGRSQILIGINSTTASSGKAGAQWANAAAGLFAGDAEAVFFQAPALGINIIQALENVPAAATSNTFYGSTTSMSLTAQWRV